MYDCLCKVFQFSLIFITFLCLLQIGNLAEAVSSPGYDSENCWPLNTTLYSRCTGVGINSSFVGQLLPFREDETELSIAHLWKERMTDFSKDNDIENCSNYTDLILCSLHIPQCRDKEAVLPCRRICQEFVSDCGRRLSRGMLDYFVGVCHFLPERYGCMAPMGFKSKYDTSDLLGQTCSNVTTPQCKALGFYNYTITSYAMQEDAEHIINDILATETERCRPMLTKFLCAELVSPCFPDADEPAIYLPCNTTCHEVAELCPTFISHYRKYFHECEEHPPGNGDKGFCKIAHWNQLLDIFFTHKKEADSQAKHRTAPWKIATSVLVPLAVLVIIVIAIFVVLKKRNRRYDGFEHKILEE